MARDYQQGIEDGTRAAAKHDFIDAVKAKVGFDLLKHLDWKFEFNGGFSKHHEGLHSYNVAVKHKDVDHYAYQMFYDPYHSSAISGLVEGFMDVFYGLAINLINEDSPLTVIEVEKEGE